MRVDVSEVVVDYDLGGTTFIRRRPASTLSAMGEKTDIYIDSILSGIIQPAMPADAKLLPEGIRLSDVQVFRSAQDISVGDGKGLSPDVLVDDAGNSYRALHLKAFSKHGLYEALAVRFINAQSPTIPPGSGPPINQNGFQNATTFMGLLTLTSGCNSYLVNGTEDLLGISIANRVAADLIYLTFLQQRFLRQDQLVPSGFVPLRLIKNANSDFIDPIGIDADGRCVFQLRSDLSPSLWQLMAGPE